MSYQVSRRSGQVSWRQDMADQVRLGQTGSGHDNVRTGHVSSRYDQFRPGHIMYRQDRTRSCQIKSDQIRSDRGLVRSC